MKSRKQIVLITLVAVVVLAGGITLYSQNEKKSSVENTAESEGSSDESENTSGKEIPSTTEFTEEEKERMESQTGVTVTEDGVMEVDIGEILAEESSVTITRDQAREMALGSLGEEAEIGACDIREYEGVKYWVVQADKGKETYQIWLNADTGEEFINQKVE